jgi:hypothetical protein
MRWSRRTNRRTSTKDVGFDEGFGDPALAPLLVEVDQAGRRLPLDAGRRVFVEQQVSAHGRPPGQLERRVVEHEQVDPRGAGRPPGRRVDRPIPTTRRRRYRTTAAPSQRPGCRAGRRSAPRRVVAQRLPRRPPLVGCRTVTCRHGSHLRTRLADMGPTSSWRTPDSHAAVGRAAGASRSPRSGGHWKRRANSPGVWPTSRTAVRVR